MKKLILVIVAVLSFASIGFAQSNIVFGGPKYSIDAAGKKTIALSGGFGTKFIGDLWSFNSVDFSLKTYAAVAPDLAYFFKVTGDSTKTRVYFAPLAGPNVDWVAAASEVPDYISYLVGAGGGLLYVETKNAFGGYLAFKYKFALKEGTFYKDGFIVGLGISKKF